MYYTTFFRCRQCFCKAVLAANYEPQATKSFLIQQFFKNAGEVWASSPHLRSKSDFQIKLQQKSRRKSKESQLPFQSRGCNENTRFQGQLRFPGKLGMCPSLAEPYASGFPKTSRRQPKSFLIQQFFKNAGEVWASSPHLRSKSDFQIKLQQKSRRKSKESQLPFQSRGCNENTRFQGQLRFPGKLGMCPSLAEPYASGFPKTSRRQPKVF